MDLLPNRDLIQIADALEDVNAFESHNALVESIVRGSLSIATKAKEPISYLIDHTALGLGRGTNGTGVHGLMQCLRHIGQRRSLLNLMATVPVRCVVTHCGFSGTPWPIRLERVGKESIDIIRQYKSVTGDSVRIIEKIIDEIDQQGHVVFLAAYQNDLEWIGDRAEWFAAMCFGLPWLAGDAELQGKYAKLFSSPTSINDMAEDFGTLLAVNLFRLKDLYVAYKQWAPSPEYIGQRLAFVKAAQLDLAGDVSP